MELLRPNFSSEDFKTAAPAVLVPVPLAFKDGAYFKSDVLDELDTD